MAPKGNALGLSNVVGKEGFVIALNLWEVNLWCDTFGRIMPTSEAVDICPSLSGALSHRVLVWQ